MAFGGLRGSFENNSTSPGTGIAATGSIAVTAGDLIVVNYAMRGAATSLTFSDNLGNTYNALNAAGSGNGRIQPFWARVASNGTLTTVTAAHTSTSNDAALCVAIFEGVFASSPLDINATVGTDSTTPYTCPASGTLAQADELVVGFVAQGNGGNDGGYGGSSGYSLAVDESTGTGANTASGCIVYLVVSATTTTTPEATSSASTSGSVGTASFKKDTGGGPAFNVQPTMFAVF